MKAAVVYAPGGADALTLAELPDPGAGEAEVVVAVEAAGVNPVDIGNRSDPRWSGVPTPYIVGYEFAGHVIEVGLSVTDLRIGDPVWGLLPVRGTQWGANAEYLAVSREHVARRPSELDPAEAACLPLAAGTALQVLDRLDLAEGGWLLVHGAAGGVGHLLVQLAASRGVRVAAVSREVDRDRLTALGAELWLDRSSATLPEAAAVAHLGHELDAVVDLVGGRLVDAQDHVRPGGGLATVVDLNGDFSEALDRNLRLHGVLIQPGRDLLESLAREVRAGLRPTIRGCFALDDVALAHERLEAGGIGGKLVLTLV